MAEEVLYKRMYRMNTVGKDGYTTTVAMPPEVIRREAEKRGLTVPKFLERFIAVAQYNNIDGVLYTFKEKK